jgi:hypothetical protein
MLLSCDIKNYIFFNIGIVFFIMYKNRCYD